MEMSRCESQHHVDLCLASVLADGLEELAARLLNVDVAAGPLEDGAGHVGLDEDVVERNDSLFLQGVHEWRYGSRPGGTLREVQGAVDGRLWGLDEAVEKEHEEEAMLSTTQRRVLELVAPWRR